MRRLAAEPLPPPLPPPSLSSGPALLPAALPEDALLRIFALLDPLFYRSQIIGRSRSLWESAAGPFLAEANGLVSKELSLTQIEHELSNRASKKLRADPKESVEELQALAVDEDRRRRFLKGPAKVRVLRGHEGRVTCCGVSGQTVASGGVDKLVRIWRARTGTQCAVYPMPNGSTIADLTLDEFKIQVLAAGGSEIAIWNWHTGELLRQFVNHAQPIRSICCTDENMVCGLEDGTMRLYDLYSSKCKYIFRGQRSCVTSLYIAPNSELLSSCSKNGSIEVRVVCQQLHSNGNHLVCGHCNGEIHRRDLRVDKLDLGVNIGTAITSLHWPIYGPSAISAGTHRGHLLQLCGSN
eukprot:SM000267S09851  [mRNA]  locus=s267:54360:56677:+ [translate_table: standard]